MLGVTFQGYIYVCYVLTSYLHTYYTALRIVCSVYATMAIVSVTFMHCVKLAELIKLVF